MDAKEVGQSKMDTTEGDSEQSESESYETCDSGVSDDDGSTKSEDSRFGAGQRTRSVSDSSEFADALDRYYDPFFS